jgi:hypothetical protein
MGVAAALASMADIGPSPLEQLRQAMATKASEIDTAPFEQMRQAVASLTASMEPKQKLMPHVIAALREVGRPMSRNDLFDHLVSKGVHIPGKDPKANLSAHLSYSDEITRDGEGRWVLRQKEIEGSPEMKNAR